MAKGVKGTGTPAKVRIGYLIYRVTVDDSGIEVLGTTRSAEKALELVDQNEGAKYLRFEMN
jgi:hypothetical protein